MRYVCTVRYLLFVLIISSTAFGRKPVPASRFEQLTGKKLTSDTKSMWDQLYNRSQFVYGKAPARFISQNYHFLPYGSSVLDMGMGEGRNAVFLAKKGYKVTGIDISSVAVKKAQLLAKEFKVKIKTVVASLNDYDFGESAFDSIICFYYVDRSLIEKMTKWLKPGGHIIFEAFNIKQRAKEAKKAASESYYLKDGELFDLFEGFKILKFEEPLHLDNYTSSIIIQKPKD